MFGRSKPLELNVVVLRDTEVIAHRVREALADATPEERPGLERAAALVEQAAAASDAELRTRWVHERLAAAGHEGPADSVQAIKTLRESAPGLSLLSAVKLVKEATAHGG